MENARLLRAGLRELGYEVAESPTAIVAVPMGDFETCVRYCKTLFEEGVAVSAALSPSVPKGHEMLRIGASASYTAEHVERVLGAFAAAGRRLPPVAARAAAGPEDF